MDDDRDSLSPHVEGIFKSARARTALINLLKWLVFVVTGTVVVPTYEIVSAWLGDVKEDHITAGLNKKHVADLETARAKADRDWAEEVSRVRFALVAIGRQQVEAVAAQRKQSVTATVDDYDQLVKKWRDREPECRLDPLGSPTQQQCPNPAEAARRALAVRR